MFFYRILRRQREDVTGPSPPPDAGHQPSSNNLAAQSGDNNNSNNSPNCVSNDHTLSTSITFTTVYDSLSQTSSAPPPSAPSSQNPGSIPSAYYTRDEDLGSSSKIPAWSFSHTKSNSPWCNMYEEPRCSSSYYKYKFEQLHILFLNLHFLCINIFRPTFKPTYYK